MYRYSNIIHYVELDDMRDIIYNKRVDLIYNKRVPLIASIITSCLCIYGCCILLVD